MNLAIQICSKLISSHMKMLTITIKPFLHMFHRDGIMQSCSISDSGSSSSSRPSTPNAPCPWPNALTWSFSDLLCLNSDPQMQYLHALNPVKPLQREVIIFYSKTKVFTFLHLHKLDPYLRRTMVVMHTWRRAIFFG